MRVLLKKQNNLRFEHFSAGDPHYQVSELFIRCIEFKSVQIKEHKRGHSADTFVPVKEWMVLDEVKKVCGSHLRNGRMQVFAGEC